MSPRAACYAAYGLHIRSEIPLPFFVGVRDAEPDITIRIDRVGPRAGRTWLWSVVPGVVRLNVKGVGCYLIRGGREIVVQPAGGSEEAVRVFLLGSALAVCLQQRGMFTTHASSIETGGGSVLFMGSSGSGKSTLLAALIERGYRMLADDLTGVVLGAGGRPTALPAVPCVRLWADAVDALGWRERTRGKLRRELEKHLAPVDGFRATPLVVRAVFVLETHNRDHIKVLSVRPADAVKVLFRYTYRKRGVRPAGGAAEHFRVMTALARRVRVQRLKRPAHPFLLDALADRIEQCLRGDEPPAPERACREAGAPAVPAAKEAGG